MVEQLIRNQQVAGSSPATSSINRAGFRLVILRGLFLCFLYKNSSALLCFSRQGACFVEYSFVFSVSGASSAWILTCRRLKFCATFIVYFRQNCAIIQIERLWLSVIFYHKNRKNRRKSVRAGPAADAWLHRRYHIGRKISRIRQHRTGRRHFWQL